VSELRKAYCPRCGEDTKAVAMGEIRKATLSNGQLVYAQKGREAKMQADLVVKNMVAQGESLTWIDLEPDERVPDNSVCEKCANELSEWADMVKRGGVYFKCRECGANGIVHAGTELAEQVRESQKIAAPAPVGMEFAACEQHKQLLESV
jgi:predicted RNA-binding Zn-ribbon protein involved in translation (DUF1610 family)